MLPPNGVRVTSIDTAEPFATVVGGCNHYLSSCLHEYFFFWFRRVRIKPLGDACRRALTSLGKNLPKLFVKTMGDEVRILMLHHRIHCRYSWCVYRQALKQSNTDGQKVDALMVC